MDGRVGVDLQSEEEEAADEDEEEEGAEEGQEEDEAEEAEEGDEEIDAEEDVAGREEAASMKTSALPWGE